MWFYLDVRIYYFTGVERERDRRMKNCQGRGLRVEYRVYMDNEANTLKRVSII